MMTISLPLPAAIAFTLVSATSANAAPPRVFSRVISFPPLIFTRTPVATPSQPLARRGSSHILRPAIFAALDPRPGSRDGLIDRRSPSDDQAVALKFRRPRSENIRLGDQSRQGVLFAPEL